MLMTSADDMDSSEALPSEIEALYREKYITTEDLPSVLRLRDDLIRAVPQPRAEFQAQLAQQLKAEFKQYPPKSLWTKLIAPRLTAALAIMLVLSMGTVLAINAVLLQLINHDPGLQSVFTSGEGFELNQSQTVDHYTVYLEWANVDKNRLTIGFSLSGLICSADYVTCDIDVKVFDQKGREVPMIDGRSDQDESVTVYLYNFDLSHYESDELINSFLFQVLPYGMTNEGSEPSQPHIIRGSTKALSEPITLSFTLPASRQVRIYSMPQSVTDQSITLTLRRVIITPSQIRTALCLIPPTQERRWTTIPRLTVNGHEVLEGGTTLLVSEIGEAETEVCHEHVYNAAMFDYVGKWHLGVGEVIGFGINGGDQQRFLGVWLFEFFVP
jgi:hypothetical protein